MMIDTVVVDPKLVLSDVSHKPFGININYLRDHDDNRPNVRPLREAILETGSRHLRYPGGEKSDWHLFDPQDPQQIGPYIKFAEGNRKMTFDDFIQLCRDTHTQPHIVVACDSLARTGVTEDQFLDNAIKWITYANITRRYAVKYWEVGNENWHNQTAPPQEMARIVRRFSAAMKAIDPEILICASGNNEAWWSEFLPLAADCIDRLVVSQYTGWNYQNYTYFAVNDDLDMIATAELSLRCIDTYAAADKNRLKTIIAELNSMDYAENGWPAANNLGHALVTFCIFGKMLQQPRLDYGMLWNTRWMNQEEQHRSLFYGLDGSNRLLPSAMPLKIWSSYLQDLMVSADCPSGLVSFASLSCDGRQLSVFVINKGFDERQIRVEVDGRTVVCHRSHTFSGSGPDDLQPQLIESTCVGDDGIIRLTPVTLSILEFELS